MTLRPPPSEGSPVVDINQWCQEADAHLSAIGFPGHPADIATQLSLRALAACLGVDGDEFDAAFAVERIRYIKNILPHADRIASQARLLRGGIQLPGQNGHPQ